MPNGVSVSHPVLGSLAITGRDLLLAVVLLALGAGAVAVQWITFTAFQRSVSQDLTLMLSAIDTAARERDQILAVVRAETCGEAIAADRPYVSRSDTVRSKAR